MVAKKQTEIEEVEEREELEEEAEEFEAGPEELEGLEEGLYEEIDESEIFEVYEDEDGNEYLLIDGKRVPFNPDEYEEVEVIEENEFGEDFNPLAYENVQAATDVANDLARAGGSIAKEGMALAGELKEAMDDINSMLDFKSWLK